MKKLYSVEDVNDYFINSEWTWGVIVVNLDGNEKPCYSYLEAIEWVNARNK